MDLIRSCPCWLVGWVSHFVGLDHNLTLPRADDKEDLPLPADPQYGYVTRPTTTTSRMDSIELPFCGAPLWPNETGKPTGLLNDQVVIMDCNFKRVQQP